MSVLMDTGTDCVLQLLCPCGRQIVGVTGVYNYPEFYIRQNSAVRCGIPDVYKGTIYI